MSNNNLSIENLEINGVEVFNGASTNEPAICISWEANIGFGQYILYQKNGRWYGQSECMDNGTDKSFLTKLMTEFIKNIIIEE